RRCILATPTPPLPARRRGRGGQPHQAAVARRRHRRPTSCLDRIADPLLPRRGEREVAAVPSRPPAHLPSPLPITRNPESHTDLRGARTRTSPTATRSRPPLR